MEETYLILRNNQEKGPFSASQLAAFPLLPDDLVWMEGKSVSWQYPTEIDALKPMVKTKGAPAAKPVYSLFQAQDFDPNTLVPATYVYVQKPKKESGTNAEISETEELLSADQLQKKADEIYQRVMVFSKQQEAYEKERKEAAKSTSLLMMQEKYELWKKQQRRKTIQRKRWAVGAGVTTIAATGFLLTTYYLPATTKQPVHLENLTSNAMVTKIKPEVKTNSTTGYTNKPVSTNSYKYVSAPSTVDAFLDSVEKALARHERKSYKPKVESTTTTTAVKKATNNEVVLVIDKVQAEMAPPEVKTTVPLKQAVSVTTRPVYRNNNDLLGVYVTVKNNHTEPLQKVLVNVTYYKKNGQLADAQTLIYQNIEPASTITLPSQIDKKAAKATTRLIQVN